MPYGTTVDGQEWQYNSVAGDVAPDLTAPPSKVIAINGAKVQLVGGTIDLSGGGDLQAIEWVPGTGGTRDVLSQYNVSYPSSGAPVTTPLYPDARNVYAIVPSYEAPVAAYDPVYAQSDATGQRYGENADAFKRRRAGGHRRTDRPGGLSVRRARPAGRHLRADAGQICHAPRSLSCGREHRRQQCGAGPKLHHARRHVSGVWLLCRCG